MAASPFTRTPAGAACASNTRRLATASRRPSGTLTPATRIASATSLKPVAEIARPATVTIDAGVVEARWSAFVADEVNGVGGGPATDLVAGTKMATGPLTGVAYLSESIERRSSTLVGANDSDLGAHRDRRRNHRAYSSTAQTTTGNGAMINS